MKPEFLHSTENNLTSTESKTTSPESIQHAEIESLFQARMHVLESVKESLSLKFYYALKEKVEAEKQAFLNLFNLQEKKRDLLSNYSFILDSQYFEQHFLSAS